MGYRTIMGYSAAGHRIRVNYYNPNVLYEGFPTGIANLSNNAKLITGNRFAMASCGTEEPNGECNDCSINPANEACLNCCETVTLSSTDSALLGSGYSIFVSTYTKYTVNSTLNYRTVYKHSSRDYCMYYAGKRWRINKCSQIGSYSYFMASNFTVKQCVHSTAPGWNYGGNFDPTAKVMCDVECSSDPPSAPTGATSDWNGVSKTAGTIVTYTCSSSSASKKAVCDPSTAAWIPSEISSDLCGSSTETTTTITTTATTTTTTTKTTTTAMTATKTISTATTTTTMESTTTGSKDCGIKNTVPALKNLKTIKKVASAS